MSFAEPMLALVLTAPTSLKRHAVKSYSYFKQCYQFTDDTVLSLFPIGSLMPIIIYRAC